MPNELEVLAGALWRAGLVLFGLPCAVWALGVCYGVGIALNPPRERKPVSR